jgi:hypothetical protein
VPSVSPDFTDEVELRAPAWVLGTSAARVSPRDGELSSICGSCQPQFWQIPCESTAFIPQFSQVRTLDPSVISEETYLVAAPPESSIPSAVTFRHDQKCDFRVVSNRAHRTAPNIAYSIAPLATVSNDICRSDRYQSWYVLLPQEAHFRRILCSSVTTSRPSIDCRKLHHLSFVALGVPG